MDELNHQSQILLDVLCFINKKHNRGEKVLVKKPSKVTILESLVV